MDGEKQPTEKTESSGFFMVLGISHILSLKSLKKLASF
jgi:hypothetical protein